MSHTYRLNLVRDGKTETGIYVRGGIYLDTVTQKKYAKRNDRRLQRRSNGRIVAEGLRDWEADISDAIQAGIDEYWYDDEPMDFDDWGDIPNPADFDDVDGYNDPFDDYGYDPDPSWWYGDNYHREMGPTFSQQMAQVPPEELVNELQIIVREVNRAENRSEETFWTNHKNIVVAELLARMAAAKTVRHKDADTGSHYAFAPEPDYRMKEDVYSLSAHFSEQNRQNFIEEWKDGKSLGDILAEAKRVREQYYGPEE